MNELYLKCSCNIHELGIELDPKDQEDFAWFSFWNRYYEEYIPFKEKIKIIWNTIRGRRTLIDEIILNKDQTIQIFNFLKENIKDII